LSHASSLTESISMQCIFHSIFFFFGGTGGFWTQDFKQALYCLSYISSPYILFLMTINSLQGLFPFMTLKSSLQQKITAHTWHLFCCLRVWHVSLYVGFWNREFYDLFIMLHKESWSCVHICF
jgi:hypothetical protein